MPAPRTTSVLLPLVGWAAAAACGSEPAIPVSCGEGEPAGALLSGPDTDLSLLDDGGHVFLRCGGQGLRHVRLRVRATGIGGACRFHTTMVDAGTGEFLGLGASDRLIPFHAEGAACESPDLLLIVEAPTPTLRERAVRIRLEIEDGDGRAVRLERQVVVDTTQTGCGR